MNLNLTLSCCFPLSLGLAVSYWATSVRRTWKVTNHQLGGCCFTLEYILKCKCHCDAVLFSYILIMLILRIICVPELLKIQDVIDIEYLQVSVKLFSIVNNWSCIQRKCFKEQTIFTRVIFQYQLVIHDIKPFITFLLSK